MTVHFNRSPSQRLAQGRAGHNIGMHVSQQGASKRAVRGGYEGTMQEGGGEQGREGGKG